MENRSTAKKMELINYLNQYNTFWVTVDNKKYLCLDYCTAPISFSLGRFNSLNVEITTINFIPDDFYLVIHNNVAVIRKSDGTVIEIRGELNKEHTFNDKPFDKSLINKKYGYDLFHEEFIDYTHSFDKGNYRYYVLDLFKLGKLDMEAYDYFRGDFEHFDRTGKTLTLCYICDLTTRKVKKLVIWDIVNECEMCECF